jgi:hypothetical protein
MVQAVQAVQIVQAVGFQMQDWLGKVATNTPLLNMKFGDGIAALNPSYSPLPSPIPRFRRLERLERLERFERISLAP